MKRLISATFLVLLLSTVLVAQEKPVFEVKIITSIESIIPNGLGRSRLLSTDSEVNYRDFTSRQTEDTDDRNKSDREEIRIKDYDETKMLNFFNVAGIRFQNIVSNDALITSKINEMLINGWDLAFVNTGVESYGGKDDSNGIYITRYIFKREKTTTSSSLESEIQKLDLVPVDTVRIGN